MWPCAALAQDTRLIVMDEPTASLDFGNQVLVLTEVQRLAASGIVLSTHNPDHALACATRAHLLAGGTTQTAGAPVDVLRPQILSAVYGVPVAVERLASGRRVCVPAEWGG